MKTEAEFNHKLKICLRRARKKLIPQRIAGKMGVYPGIYFGMENSMLTMSVYHLYVFMHATGKDMDFIRQIFDDGWNPPSMRKVQVTDNG